MDENLSPVSIHAPDVEPTASKRPAPSSDDTPTAPRSKRGKYTSVACNECKKKKLKCIPVTKNDKTTCERCIANGVHCAIVAPPPPVNKKKDDSHQIQLLGDELAKLRQQVSDLSRTVDGLKHHSPGSRATATSPGDGILARSPSNASRDNVPKHPQFVGPTRPSYGLVIAERSLARMGIPASPSQSASGAPSPAPVTSNEPTDVEFWAECSAEEMARLLSVFEEEVESVYPFIDILDLALRSEQILQVIRDPALLEVNDLPHDIHKPALTATDVELAKLAVATGIAIEAHGKNELCTAISESVVAHTSRISRTEVDLKGIQLLLMLSIYYFHCDDELVAWRTIGIAARECLEMGLHRSRSLYDNFSDPQSRHMAKRVFWCCYVLDRRWSFGTSLSFALTDRDIDPALLEPDIESSYLKCMVGYARLCSKLWDAIPPFGSACQSIPRQVANELDSNAKTWLESIPSHLRMRHPKSFYSTRSQPRVLQRLRALLYFRGNLTRISIHQHHLLSAAAIKADLERAKIAVEVAQDTVHVLVHLNDTSDIYSRQQNAFNYFLLNALAVICLAVCHAPDIFAASCTSSFVDAISLIKGFSRHSIASRRLWKSIRGLLPRLKTLGLREDEDGDGEASIYASARQVAPTTISGNEDQLRGQLGASTTRNENIMWDTSGQLGHQGVFSDIPDAMEMNSDIMNLFDSIGQGLPWFGNDFDAGMYSSFDADMNNGEGTDISRVFLQGLM